MSANINKLAQAIVGIELTKISNHNPDSNDEPGANGKEYKYDVKKDSESDSITKDVSNDEAV